MQTIGDIIRDREPYWVEAEHTIERVVEYMCERKIGAVAVKEGDRVVGVFSERDLLHRVVRKRLDPTAIPVREVMSRGLIPVSPDEEFERAKAEMFGRNVRHLVVMDDQETFRGLVSMRDLMEMDIAACKALVSQLNDKYYQGALKRD